MNTPEDSIDALLREQNSYQSDNGFTARVVKELPRHRRNWLRPVILLAAVIVGAMLAWWWLPLKNMPPLDFSKLQSLNSSVLSTWLTVLVVVGSLVWGAITALRSEE